MRRVLWPLLFFLCWPTNEGATSSAESDIKQLSVNATMVVPTASLALDPNGSNQKCVEDSLRYAMAFVNRTRWAVTMFEASGKLPNDPYQVIMDNLTIHPNTVQEGILFDLCLGSTRGDDMPKFEAQYCTVYLSAQPVSSDDTVVDGLLKEPKTAEAARQLDPFVPVLPTNIMAIDFCLPSSCTAYDLRMAVAQKVGRTIFERNKDRQRHSLLTITHDRHCHTHEKNNKESAPDWLACVCYAVIGMIVILAVTGTIHEAVQGRITSSSSSRKTVQILNCFSVMRNLRNLWTTDASSDHISCLNGLRVLSTSGIIIFHVGGEIFRQLLFDNEKMAKILQNPINKPAGNLSFLVDTFFVIGGLLACMGLLRDLDRGRFNLRRLFFHRYVRLTAAYAVVILLTAGLIGSSGSGPQWYHVKYKSEDCRAYWWTHLLYVNNYVPWHTTYCMFETWYLANDMHMFLFSPLVIYPLWRWRRAGVAWALLLLTACVGINVAIHILSFVRISAQYGRILYVNAIPRYNPYLIGILLGWFLHHNKNVKIALKRTTVACGWILSVTALVAILCGLTPYLDEEETPVIDPYFRVLYGSFSRTIWGISIAWIVFACAKGHGGWANTFLSCKAFVPLAGVSYSAYLVQYGIVITLVSSSRTPFHLLANDFEISALKALLGTFLAAFVLTIFVDMPFRSFEKIFLKENKAHMNDDKRLKRQ